MDHVRSMGHGSTQREEVCSQDWTGRVWRCAARTRWTERCGRVCHTHGARETPVGCRPSLDEHGLARRCGRCIHTTLIPQGDSHDFVSRVTSDPDSGGMVDLRSFINIVAGIDAMGLPEQPSADFPLQWAVIRNWDGQQSVEDPRNIVLFVTKMVARTHDGSPCLSPIRRVVGTT